MPDRQEEATNYLHKHKIPTLMENLLAKLLYHQPENPASFLVSELEQLIQLRRDVEREAPTLFTEANVAALFDQYDINRRGVITGRQYSDAFHTLALPLVVTPEAHYTKAQFLDDVKESLKLKACAFY